MIQIILSQFHTKIFNVPVTTMNLRMQDMLQNKTQVETVNFRLYFKVIIRQNHSVWWWLWNKVENLQFQPASCFEAYLAFSRCRFSEFAFYCTFLNCRLVMVFWTMNLVAIIQAVTQILANTMQLTNINRFHIWL